MHGVTGGTRLGDEAIARIGDQRRARISGIGNGEALGQPTHNLRPSPSTVAVMVAHQPSAVHSDSMQIQELARASCILTSQDIGSRQHIQRAQCDITDIPDRRRNEP